MTKKSKIQGLLITHLKKQGSIELILPDGITVEIGITQMNHDGKMIIDDDDDYCWVVAKRENNTFLLDSFNLGLSYEDDPRTIVLEDVDTTDEGVKIKFLDVV